MIFEIGRHGEIMIKGDLDPFWLKGNSCCFGICPSLTASSLPALSGVAEAKEWGKFDARRLAVLWW